MSLPASLKLLIALRFYATGNFQTVTGDLHGIHQTTVCRVACSVTKMIANLRLLFVRYSLDKTEEVQNQFYQIGGFPKVRGVIDCTHVQIIGQGGDDVCRFINRKTWSPINVQAVGGSDYKIYDVVARWPGSVHNSRIFENSTIKEKFENNEILGFLLGDVGYPCLRYLMTPLLHPSNNAECRNNRALITTRIVIERIFGILKRWFPCIAKKLYLKLDRILCVIVAVIVLHNFAIDNKKPELGKDEEISNDPVTIQL